MTKNGVENETHKEKGSKQNQSKKRKQVPETINKGDEEWQSDGIFKLKTLSQSEKGILDCLDESDDAKDSKKGDTAEEKAEKDKEPIWCTS
jgi:hypothetical protein